MTEQKMQQINAWLKRINKGKLEMQEIGRASCRERV